MTPIDYEKARPLIDKFKLWLRASTWLHNDTDNKLACELWVRYIGTMDEYNTIVANGCRTCNKQHRIYKDIYNLWIKQ